MNDEIRGHRLAVVGSRGFENFDLLVKILDRLRLTKVIDAIISGGAQGVDSMAEHYADVNEIPTVIHLADWEQYGKGAGYIRNKLIWDDADIGLAIWDGVSKGTSHSFGIAEKQGKKLYIFDYVKNRWVDKKGNEL